MGIYSITGLPSNLTYEITDYDLHDKLCDNTGSCSLGATKNFYLTIKYVDGGFNSSQTSYDIKLEFEFRKMHEVTYSGITNNNYPTSVIDGGTLTFTTTENIPPKIIAFYSNNDRVDYDDYSYENNVFTYDNVTSDVTLKYQEKAYMAIMADDTYYKESAYITVIDSIQFVNYVDTDGAVVTYDLSEISGSQDVIGWITSDNDLYIGSEWNIYSKNLDCAFNGMSSVQTITFNNFNTSECTNMHYMFKDCSNLISLDVTSFDTTNVQSMNGTFYGLSQIKTLDLSNFNTVNVTDMNGIFGQMTSLSSLNISSFDTSNVTIMSQMFYNCSSLTSLDVSKFNTNKVTTMYYMFTGCSSLSSLDVTNFNTSSVTNMGRMFQDLTGVTQLDVTHFDTSKVTAMHGMFSGMTSLSSLDLSSFNTSNVTTMYEMFRNLKGLQTLDLSNFDTVKVTAMYSMFAGCTMLENLDLSNFDTSGVTDMNSMFNGNYSLKELKFNNATFDNVTSAVHMFYNVNTSINVTTKNATTKAWLESALGDGVGTVTIASA